MSINFDQLSKIVKEFMEAQNVPKAVLDDLEAKTAERNEQLRLV